MINALKRRRQPRAGRHLDQWFWAAYRPWRRRARFVFGIVALPLGALTMAFAVIWPSWSQFLAGCTVGMLAAMYVCLIDTPPDWIDRKRRGRDGERRTEQRLRPLERGGWRVAHDIDSGHGNLDHVAVGPPGVYLLETKNLTGEASVDQGVLSIARGDDDRDTWRSDSIGNAAKRAAIELRNHLQPQTGTRWVQAVVVLWCDFPAGYVESDSVVYLHGGRVYDWLNNQAPGLTPQTVDRVGGLIERLERDGLHASAGVADLANRRSAA